MNLVCRETQPEPENTFRLCCRGSSRVVLNPSIPKVSSFTHFQFPVKNQLHSSDHAHRTTTQRHLSYTSLGGYDDPLTLPLHYLTQRFPNIRHQLQRTFTIPAESIYTPEGADDRPEGARPVPYLSFSATVGRNSDFRRLSERQYEELGGVEYRALSALMWIVPMVSDR